MQFSLIRHAQPRDPCKKYPEKKSPTTYLVHLRLKFDLDDVASNNTTGKAKKKNKPFTNSDFDEVQRLELNDTASEDVVYKNGLAMVSDQFNDRIFFVALDPSARVKPLIFKEYTGYHMSHWVRFSPYDEGMMGVTHYGDNSVIVQEIYPEVKQYMDEYAMHEQESHAATSPS